MAEAKEGAKEEEEAVIMLLALAAVIRGSAVMRGAIDSRPLPPLAPLPLPCTAIVAVVVVVVDGCGCGGLSDKRWSLKTPRRSNESK